MKRTISFYTLGCRLNQSETAVLQNTFEQSGYQVRRFGERTDIVVLNTCTVTENSETDARRLVNRIIRHNPKSSIALVGCQAQLHATTLANWPNVRWIIGTAQKMDLVSILAQPVPPEPKILIATIPRKFIPAPTAGIDREHTRANLKIQDGCNAFCSFCEVPYARGRARSREFSDILKEARVLAQAKHKELVLTGVNIGHYADATKTLYDVIAGLREVSGLERIRISSLEPAPICRQVIGLMKEMPQLCRHLHIPVQSGSAEILKLMRRTYKPVTLARLICFAIREIPDICLGTDVIVGFPGETERHFEETYEFLKKNPIHYFHVFSYSERKMAKSRQLPGKIPRTVIKRRSEILRRLGEEKRHHFYKSMLGKTVLVLFEQRKGQRWTGLTDNFLHVAVNSSKNLHNQILRVQLNEIFGQHILGDLRP